MYVTKNIQTIKYNLKCSIMETKPENYNFNLQILPQKKSVIKAIHVYENLVLTPSPDDVSSYKTQKQSRKSRMLEKLTKKAKFNNRYFESSYTLEKNKRQAIVRSQGYFKY